jgi:hypothetical protein
MKLSSAKIKTTLAIVPAFCTEAGEIDLLYTLLLLAYFTLPLVAALLGNLN